MYQGYYISLPRDERRREVLCRHLAERGALQRYCWFEAVDGRAVADKHPATLDPGALGLWLSHARLLESVRGARQHLHILEDDAVLAQGAVEQFDRLLANFDAEMSDWDLIFTDLLCAPHDVELFRALARSVRHFEATGEHAIIDLKPVSFSGMSSIFVNWRSLDRFAGLLDNQWSRGAPLDIFLRHVINQGSLKAYMIVPFLTSMSDEGRQSTIRDSLTRTNLVVNTYRQAFFQDADVRAVATQLAELTKDLGPPAPLIDVCLRTLHYWLSDQWEQF